MYQLIFTRAFKKGLKRYRHQKSTLAKIEAALFVLRRNGALPTYGEHALAGRFIGLKECHIEPDLLLVYRIVDERTISLQDIGTHAYIFE